jgi:hypothetical protein
MKHSVGLAQSNPDVPSRAPANSKMYVKTHTLMIRCEIACLSDKNHCSFSRTGLHYIHVHNASPDELSALQPPKVVDSRVRNYATALIKAKEALDYFNAGQGRLQCILQLGDIMDGQETKEESVADLEAVASEFDRLVRFPSCGVQQLSIT